MPTTFSWLSFLVLFFFGPIVVSASPRRRILHQPFVPLNSLPPSEPPLPPPSPNPNPKYPFSTSAPSPPTDSPFFPSFPAPPPPPSPATFASFPANISSLILPHSPSPKASSHKLVALSIAAVVSTLFVLAVAAFFYWRRRSRRSDLSDDKTFRSENSSRFFPSSNAERSNSRRAQRLRTGSGASSEFLYLGTMVDSRRIDEGANPHSNGERDGRFEARKMVSPELHPLPPLAWQNSELNCGNNSADVNSTAEEEEEEFYSPRGSLGGRESSIGTGSSSRRAFAAVAAENFKGRISGSSESSQASSGSASPDRSHSISSSPPVSSSPKRAEFRSPESSDFPAPPPPPPPSQPQMVSQKSVISPFSSPEKVSEKTSAVSPRLSNASHENVLSPSLSPLSSSPDRALKGYTGTFDGTRPSPLQSSASSSPARGSEKNLEASPIKQSRSPSLSSLSSPERALLGRRDISPRTSNVSEKKWQVLTPSPPSRSPERESARKSDARSISSNDSVGLSFDIDPQRGSLSRSSSPEMFVEKNRDSASSALVASDRKRLSPSPSLSSSLSSERVLDEYAEKSPRATNDSDQKKTFLSPFSPPLSPERDLAKNPDASPRISNASDESLYALDPKRRSLSSSAASSSPERDFHNNSDASPRTSNDSDQSAESPVRTSTSSAIKQPLGVPPPPPLSFRQWDVPTLVTPTGPPAMSKPPPLIPPSRPFVLQNPANVSVSPMELPPVSNSVERVDETPKPKLKPLHWDKVRASSDREMVWDQLRSSSFKLNEEMIETLFVVNNPNLKPKETTPRSVLLSPNVENRVLDPKKSQNIAISLRALNVTTEEVCEALLEGSADALGSELLESLLKMAPTKEEERKLKEYKDDSPIKLGPAERFLKAVLDVPFAFKRVDAMLYIANFESEVDYLKKSFETLESACEELRNSRMFMKLLEAVLKTGNRMNVGTNRGDAHAFKLDTLLKLVDVKGADGKTTLLHFVVQEIIRTEGARFSSSNDVLSSSLNDDVKCRKLGLEVVSGLSSELANVKKAATMDSDVLGSDVSKLSKGISEIKEVVKVNETTGLDESNQKFSESMDRFMKMAEEEIIRIQAQESVAMSLVKEITEYFHGNSAKEEAHPFRIFMVVRDFLTVLDRVCKEVGMINERTIVSSAHRFPVPVNPMLAQALGVTPQRPFNSSDDEST